MAKQIVGKYFKTSLTFINEVYNKEQKVLWNQKSDSERKFDWFEHPRNGFHPCKMSSLTYNFFVTIYITYLLS